MHSASGIGVRELDRQNGGIEVTLFWDPHTDRMFLAVDDERSGDRLGSSVDSADALDGFPYAYAYAKVA